MMMARAKASHRNARIGVGVGVTVVASLVALAASSSNREATESRQPLTATAALSASVGVVLVESDPPLATILVDGRALGTTPYRAELPIGSHKLAVTKDGFLADLETITITESPLTRSVHLHPDDSHATPEAGVKQKPSASTRAQPRSGLPVKSPPLERPQSSVPPVPPKRIFELSTTGKYESYNDVGKQGATAEPP